MTMCTHGPTYHVVRYEGPAHIAACPKCGTTFSIKRKPARRIPSPYRMVTGTHAGRNKYGGPGRKRGLNKYPMEGPPPTRTRPRRGVVKKRSIQLTLFTEEELTMGMAPKTDVVSDAAVERTTEETTVTQKTVTETPAQGGADAPITQPPEGTGNEGGVQPIATPPANDEEGGVRPPYTPPASSEGDE